MEYQIKDGTKAGALEVYFEGKPDSDTRQALKDNGARWNGGKGCWWLFADRALLEGILTGAKLDTGASKANGAKAVKAETLPDKKPEYMELLKLAEGNGWESWQKYYNGKINAAYEIGRYIIGFDKPSIETRFCFGYGYCGVSTTEDMESASNMAEYARTDQEYFIRQNLKDFDKELEHIKTVQYNRKQAAGEAWSCARAGYDVSNMYFRQKYYKNVVIMEVCYATYNTEYEARHNGNELLYLTDDEIKTYKKAVEIERAKMQKRLETYLKKYGLSKLHTWSYLSD